MTKRTGRGGAALKFALGVMGGVMAGTLALIPLPGAPMARAIGVTTRRGWRPTHLQSRLIAALREVAATA